MGIEATGTVVAGAMQTDVLLRAHNSRL